MLKLHTATVNFLIAPSTASLRLVLPPINSIVPSGFFECPVKYLPNKKVNSQKIQAQDTIIMYLYISYLARRIMRTDTATTSPTIPIKVATPFNRTYHKSHMLSFLISNSIWFANKY